MGPLRSDCGRRKVGFVGDANPGGDVDDFCYGEDEDAEHDGKDAEQGASWVYVYRILRDGSGKTGLSSPVKQKVDHRKNFAAYF